jgi:hypothetical protein
MAGRKVQPARLNEGKASFCEQKEAKSFIIAGPLALSAAQPQARLPKSFCAALSGYFPSS